MDRHGAELFYKKGHVARGEKSHSWRGGIKHRRGYILIKRPDHHRANSQGYVPEHILIMEEYLGRELTEQETVHHRNKKRDDNRIENLELMTKKEHNRRHAEEMRDGTTGQFNRTIREKFY